MTDTADASPKDFIRTRIADDVAAGRWGGRVVTRFPPEPNGHLHIGHAKSICLNFGVANEFGGVCNLRFDDTNPSAEDEAYVRSIAEDVRWLGFDWSDREFYASDYYERLYEYAVELIRRGKAYVCDLDAESIRTYRGTLTEPGKPSPWCERSIDENLDLFERMRAGEFDPGARVLRARIDMASSVLSMRDPVLYRIQKSTHHRTGDAWCIYPMYDFAHCLSDAIEGVTHSLCTLEFADHRPLYDWVLAELDIAEPPEQIEFARLNVSHTVMSKRSLRRLVEDGHVDGWDDPRMPTLAGLRRRGVPAAAVVKFCEGVGIAKRDNTVGLAQLEAAVRDELNRTADRYMAVLRPLKVVIENYPEGEVEELEAVNNPEDPAAGTRRVPFSRELYIERDDFMEDPPRKFFRLAPGREVRLRYAYFIRCTDVVRDAAGEIVELRCQYDPATKGGDAPDGRKVKATLHWVSAARSVATEVRLYAPLFEDVEPRVDPDNIGAGLSPASLETLADCRVEPALATVTPDAAVQFERLGYFCADPDGSPERPVFNRTVTLRDAWAKVRGRDGK